MSKDSKGNSAVDDVEEATPAGRRGWIDRYVMGGPYFALSLPAAAVVLAISVLFGTLTYCLTMVVLQNDLVDAYAEADAVCTHLRDNPSLPAAWCDRLKEDETENAARKAKPSLGLVHVAQLLADAEVVDLDKARELKDLVDPIRHPESAFILGILAQKNGLLSPPAAGERPVSTLEWVARLAMLYQDSCGASKIGGNSPKAPTLEEQTVSGLTDMLARGMSGAQYKESRSDVVAWAEDTGDENGQAVEVCRPQPLSMRGLVFAAPEAPWLDGELLTAVWGLTQQRGREADTRPALDNKINWMQANTESGRLVPVNQTQMPEQTALEAGLQGIQDFSLYLMSQVHEHPDVKSAAKWVIIFRGIEQFLMIVLLYTVSLVFLIRWLHLRQMNSGMESVKELVGREELTGMTLEKWREKMREGLGGKKNRNGVLNSLPPDTVLARLVTVVHNKIRNPEQDDVERVRSEVVNAIELVQNSRWFVKWAAYTIPALGFIGTVRGILTSLGGAGSIVYASTTAERGAAINALAGELGLAFATTLIALVIGIGISYFNDLQDANEADFLLGLEGQLVRIVDYRARQRTDQHSQPEEKQSLVQQIRDRFRRNPPA